MKLHLADTRNRYSVTGYGPGYLAVNGIRYEQALIVSPDEEPEHWSLADFSALTAAAAQSLLRSTPEIVILGTGPTQQFADPVRIRPLIEAGIGLEMMSTPAACRTYNILMGEGRRVVAAMFLP
ncbi:MAG: Mth938-like domain-containing protein [Betaproteobacteria bacterium]|nr:Mth938-like domain-containing protein [Betaproteobacteria bacterium]MDH4292674.1 Mth938-like domain-containing protein [Betaproteobacteria bacterium]